MNVLFIVLWLHNLFDLDAQLVSLFFVGPTRATIGRRGWTTLITTIVIIRFLELVCRWCPFRRPPALHPQLSARQHSGVTPQHGVIQGAAGDEGETVIAALELLRGDGRSFERVRAFRILPDFPGFEL